MLEFTAAIMNGFIFGFVLMLLLAQFLLGLACYV
jgi:hypothetical protein